MFAGSLGITMKSYRFKAQVWRWPGYGGWYFVNLPRDLSVKIKKVGKPYGSGFIKVKVTVKKSSWVTALFPHKESRAYLLSIKKNIRKKEGVYENDIIKVSFFLIK